MPNMLGLGGSGRLRCLQSFDLTVQMHWHHFVDPLEVSEGLARDKAYYEDSQGTSGHQIQKVGL